MRILAVIMTCFLAVATHANGVTINDGAPDTYTVVKGDTLWDISARFLKDPWKWPEVWGLNKEEIRNPHLIYPGDVIRLIRGDRPRLVLERGRPTIKLTPQMRAEPIERPEDGIPSIPYRAIAPFLNRGGVMQEGELKETPRILGSSDARVLFGRHDQVYAEAGQTPAATWQIVRQGRGLRDPDSNDLLGYELIFVGEAKTTKAGTPQLLTITRADQEIVERDRLLPLTQDEPPQFMPHAPNKPVEGLVMATLGGVQGAGPYSTLLVNKGRDDGLEVGHVLAAYKAGRSIADPKCLRADRLAFMAGGLDSKSDCVPDKNDLASLPDRRIGTLFVYRVFARTAYALVMNSEEPIYVRDSVKNP